MKGEPIVKYHGVIKEVLTVREIKEGKFGRYFQQKLKMADGIIVQLTGKQEFGPKDVGKELDVRDVPTPKGHSLKDGSYVKGLNTPDEVAVKQINVSRSALLELSEKAGGQGVPPLGEPAATKLPPEMEE